VDRCEQAGRQSEELTGPTEPAGVTTKRFV
jgi:hypothetical protein